MRRGAPLGAERISVCVIESNPLAASVLRRTLQRDRTIRIVPLDQVLRSQGVRKIRVSVFVLDMGTLRAPLSRFLRSVRVRFPEAKTIIVDEQRSCEGLCRLLFLGIHGFVPYKEVERRLNSAIQTVSRGHLWVREEVLEQYIAFSQKLSGLHLRGRNGLTRREKDTIELARRKFSNKEISSVLRISESTVKFHLSNIFHKLGVHNRHEVAEVLPPGLNVELARQDLGVKQKPVVRQLFSLLET